MSPYLAEIRRLVGDRLLLIPSASGCIFDVEGRILLVHQTGEGVWSTPGGAIEPGERPATACVREVREETGLVVEPRTLIGVFGGPESEVTYANGDRVNYISTAFHCDVVEGEAVPDEVEVDDVGWFSANEVAGLDPPSLQRLMLPEVLSWWHDPARRPRFRPPVT